MDAESLRQCLEHWRDGQLSFVELQRRLMAAPPAVAAITETRLDLDRMRRCGFPEVVYGVGKTPDQLLEIVTLQQQAGQPSLITRATPEHAELLRARFRAAIYQPLSRTIRVPLAASE